MQGIPLLILFASYMTGPNNCYMDHCIVNGHMPAACLTSVENDQGDLELIVGDCDGDGDVDLRDYQEIQLRFSPPE